MLTELTVQPILRSYWHPVALSRDVAEKPLAVQLLQERIALFRVSGGVVCLQDLCVHRGTPLSLGWVDGDRIVCAYHGWNYDSCGVCVKIPAIPNRPIPAKARVPSYGCTERYGLIWVCLDQQPRAPIPEFPEFDAPDHYRDLVGPFTWNCSAARAMENFVDQAHFPWVHQGILGDRDHPETIPVEVERFPEELRFGFTDKPNPMHPVLHARVYRMYRPFTIHQRKERQDGAVETSFFTVTPHSARKSTNYLYVVRNFELAPQEQLDRHALDEKIMLQDQVILENQRPEELPLDLSEELHIKGPDAVAVEYRRMMAELGVQ
jgi:phenylpropionate dioxygenase-like ring-hydroxylating dioxygenase large terminal subunit